MPTRTTSPSVTLGPGDTLAGKYTIEEVLGQGYEGAVFRAREKGTGIERSLKIYDPRRDPRNRNVRWSARKLHKLRDCSVLVQYRTQETITLEGRRLAMLVADYVPGENLASFLRRQPGKRLDFFQGLHLFRALAAGLEPVHDLGEYHGDVHDENILVRRQGLGFEVRLLDLRDMGPPQPALIRRDVHHMVRVLYDALGGARHYAGLPPEIKTVICGLRTSLMDRKFRTAGQLLWFLDGLEWESR